MKILLESDDDDNQKTEKQDDKQTYTTADYLPEDHDMNNASCQCAACTYPVK